MFSYMVSDSDDISLIETSSPLALGASIIDGSIKSPFYYLAGGREDVLLLSDYTDLSL